MSFHIISVLHRSQVTNLWYWYSTPWGQGNRGDFLNPQDVAGTFLPLLQDTQIMSSVLSRPCFHSYKSLNQPPFPLKCLSPVDLFVGRPECKDGTTVSNPHLCPIYARINHVQISQTYHSSQSSPSSQMPSPPTNLPSVSWDLLHYDMPCILNHFLALLNSARKHLIRRFSFPGRCCNDSSGIEHYQS